MGLRLNPKMMAAIRKEIIKKIDAGEAEISSETEEKD